MPFYVTTNCQETDITWGKGSIHLSLALPLLRGSARECLSLKNLDLTEQADGILGSAGDHVYFAYAQPRKGLLATQTEAAYSRLLQAVDGVQLLRIWNFIPNINVVCDGLENYQAFCLGRAEAFDKANEGLPQPMPYPAASALGIESDRLVIFGVGRARHRHGRFFENPCQTPTHHYPRCYGPRPPLFSRASTCFAEGTSEVYISGTASVTGSESRHPEHLPNQLETTRQVLETLFTEIRQEADLPSPQWLNASDVRLYLRHAKDAERAEAWLRTHFPLTEGRWRIVQADICRTDLLAEIEFSLHPNRTVPNIDHPIYV